MFLRHLTKKKTNICYLSFSFQLMWSIILSSLHSRKILISTRNYPTCIIVKTRCHFQYMKNNIWIRTDLCFKKTPSAILHCGCVICLWVEWRPLMLNGGAEIMLANWFVMKIFVELQNSILQTYLGYISLHQNKIK